jgi:hypothetical protein
MILPLASKGVAMLLCTALVVVTDKAALAGGAAAVSFLAKAVVLTALKLNAKEPQSRKDAARSKGDE